MNQNTSIDWEKCLVPEDSKITDAIKSLDKSGLKIVLIVNKKNIFQGTVSDGDIRRGLLKGLTIDSPLNEIIHRDSFKVSPNIDKSILKDLMDSNQIMQIPIVDKKGFICGLYTWDSIEASQFIPNKMVVMAGGRGKRLHPHTENCPKPLVKVRGKPMLEHIILRAKKEGFTDFIISVNYLAEMIINYFKDGDSFGVNIEYIHEDKPLGTAGSLSLLKSKVKEPFIVTNGDVITDIKYADLLNYHNSHNSSATMSVKLHQIQNPFGVVETTGNKIIGFTEKPIIKSYVNAGVYCISHENLKILKRNEYCDMPIFFERIKSANKPVIVYPMHELWADIGRPNDLSEMNNQGNDN